MLAWFKRPPLLSHASQQAGFTLVDAPVQRGGPPVVDAPRPQTITHPI